MKESPSLPKCLEEITIEYLALTLFGGIVRKRPISPNYRGLCIFHSEKTPSFYLRPRTNDFVCYGCGASGGPLILLYDVFETYDRRDKEPRPEWLKNLFLLDGARARRNFIREEYIKRGWDFGFGAAEFQRLLKNEQKRFKQE